MLFWRLSNSPLVHWWIVDCDPLAFWIANRMAEMFFDQRRLAPGVTEAVTVQVLMAITFGIECAGMGILIFALRNSIRSR